MTTIAFIGLGVMGAPMARNLLKGVHTVRAFDIPSAQNSVSMFLVSKKQLKGEEQGNSSRFPFVVSWR